MKSLTALPNIGPTLAKKLNRIGVHNETDLQHLGSEKALLRIATLKNSGACINMLYALEGAIQGIRWHHLAQDKKLELNEFYQMMQKKKG